MRRRAARTRVSCEAVSAPAFLLLCLVVLVACGGGSDPIATSSETEPRTSSTLEELWRAPGDDVAVVPGTSTYEPGRVRVSFLVVNAEGQPVLLPTARVWLARGLEEQPFLASTAKLERIGVPGRPHEDSTHIYVVHLAIREPGKYWFLAEPEGGSTAVQALGNVVVYGATGVPEVGDAAPASETPTLSPAGENAARITTRVPPDLTLLEHSVADALRDGRAFVVTFATPKFCSSRTCGPVVDVVEDVAARLEGSELRFIHVEVFKDNDPSRGYNRWMRQWGLKTEPWTFVVGASGRISARFEGPVSVHELEEAAEAVAQG